jgi:hypothetical protein
MFQQSLYASVGDFIHNSNWHLPLQLDHMFPHLRHLVHQAIIPSEPTEDRLLWKHSPFGDLPMKDSYSFKFHHSQEFKWGKLICNADVSPSKSLFVWRLMHQKIPTDENLMFRGCYLHSLSNLCLKNVNSSFHIFFECPFAVKIWSWLAHSLNLVLHFTSLENMWNICDINWSPQCKVVIISALINLLNTIWFARNQARFNNKIIPWQSAISLTIANTSLSGNNTCKATNNFIRDFTILKHFKVSTHQTRAPIIKEILWHPPLPN